jgi:uncharacterized RDD family membrane protein YckC
MHTASDTIGNRIGAYLLDRLFLLIGLLVILTPTVYFIVTSTPSDPGVTPTGPVVGTATSLIVALWLAGLLLVAVQPIYTVVMEARGGQTHGKRSADIVVVTTEGTSIGTKEALIRAVSWFFEGFFFGIPALVAILATDDSQRIGDILAGTVVVEVED